MKSVGVPVSYGLDRFKDRQYERELLTQLLSEPATRLITVVGRRGIGKSALAAKVLHDIEYRIDSTVKTSGIIYASTRTSGISLERIYLDCTQLVDNEKERRLLEVWTGQGSAAEKVDRLLRALDDGTYVILLDNLEDKLSDDGHLDDDDLWTFFDLVFRRPSGVRVLVTTQVPLKLPSELLRYDTRISLDTGLADKDAAELLRELDRSGIAGLRDTDESRLLKAAHEVYGVPRALELMVGAMCDDLLTFPTLEELLRTFAHRGDIVANLVQDRYRRLDPDGRLVLQALAAFRCPVDRSAVQFAVELLAPGMDSAPILANLVRVHMAAVDRTTRTFALHPIDADFAYGELSEDQRKAIEQRIAEWYARQALPESEWQTIDDVAAQRKEFEHRVKAHEYDAAARILDTIDEYLIWRGSIQAVLSMHQAIHNYLPGGASKATHLAGHGFARMTAGPIAEAIDLLEEALESVTESGDKLVEAKTLLWLSYAYREVRRLSDSARVAEQSAEIFHRNGHWREQLRGLFSLGLTRAYQTDSDQALSACDRMQELAEEHDDAESHARAIDIRAMALLVAGCYPETITAADDAHEWYERAGISYEKGYDHNMAGLAHLNMGEHDQASARFHAGLNDAEGAQSTRLKGICLYNLSWLHWKLDNQAVAAEKAQQAVDTCRQAGNADLDSAQALLRAYTAMRTGDEDTAASALLEAARSAIGNTDLPSVADLASEAARLARRAGRPDIAEAAESL